MRKTVINYGALTGCFATALFILAMVLPFTSRIISIEVLSYIMMLPLLILVYLGIKKLSAVHYEGRIGFMPAFICGLGITLIASIFYVVIWEGWSQFVLYQISHVNLHAAVEGLTLPKELKEMMQAQAVALEAHLKNGPNFYQRISRTIIEVFSIGFVVSLLAGVYFNSKEKRVAEYAKGGSTPQ